MIRLFITCVLVTIGILPLQSVAGDSTQFALRLSLHKGFIIPHRDTLEKPAKGAYPIATEIDFNWLNYSLKGWNKTNCYTKTGAALGYINFGKPHVLGNGFYFFLYTEPQLRFNKKINLSLTIAAGLIHLSDVFDSEKNPTNRFYSSPVSGLIRLGVAATYMLSSRFIFSTGLNFNHISNGGTRTPNLGMNYPTINFSVSYLNTPYSYLKNRFKIKSIDPALHYNIQLFTANRLIKAWDVHSGRERMAGVSFSLKKQFTHLSWWVAGSEFSYDWSLPATGLIFERDDRPMILSLIGGHDLVVGRVHFTQQLGVYLYQKYDNPNLLFQRYTLLYEFKQGIQLGFSLKTHAEIAEMIDFRAGITF